MYSIPSLRSVFTGVTFPFYTDGQVTSQVIVGDSIYIGGTFSNVGKTINLKTSNFCILNSTTAAADYLSVNRTLFTGGQVNCALISGDYIYVGGAFFAYNNEYCLYLAKISLIDGSLDPNFKGLDGLNSTVNSLALDNSGNLYVGGQFTSYKGVTRQRIVKINATTAALDTTFDSATGCNSTIYSIALDSSGNLYMGGDLTAYKGVTRQRIAKINSTTAALDTTFDSSTGFVSTVETIALDGSGNLYAGGFFTSYKGVTRQRIVKINPTTAALDTTFDSASGFGSSVSALAFDSSGNLYVGGGFSTYKGVSRQFIAKLNSTTAALDTTFDSASGFSGGITSIHVDGSGNLYAGGGFTTYKGFTRQYIAKLNSTTAALDTTFDSSVGFNGTVRAIALSGSGKIYVGGLFNSYKTVNSMVPRQRIAKISLSTGDLDTTFNSASGFDNTVSTLTLDNSGNLYAGGDFRAYKGVTRQNIAKLNSTTAALDTTFDSASGFPVGSFIPSITLDGSGNLYICGDFATYKGVTRQRIAKINATTAALDTTFDSATGFNAYGSSLAFDSSGNLYVGGQFTSYKGVTRQNIVKINATTAALDTTFDSTSGFNSTVNRIALDGSGSLYAGGFFTFYKGVARQRIAKLNTTTAALDTTFDSSVGFNSSVSALTLDNSGNLYAGGDFTTYNGVARLRIAKLNSTTAALDTTFDSSSGSSGRIDTLALGGFGNLYMGGQFVVYRAISTPWLAIIDSTTSAPKGY